MGIMSRAIRLCKADLHGVMDQMEDKDLLLRQHLREMAAAMAERQTRIDRLEETLRDGRRDLTTHEMQCQALEADLERAVARNKDDIARLLIRKLLPLRQTIAAVTQHLNEMTEQRDAEQDRLGAQRLAYDETRHRVTAARERRRSGEGRPNWGQPAWLRPSAPSEEEIEWELLQRKEAAEKGRVS